MSLELFEVGPALGSETVAPRATGRLPSICCTTCDRTWGDPGLWHPRVDLRTIPNGQRYEWNRVETVAPEEFEEWTLPFRNHVRPDLLRPGAHLGPPTEDISGLHDDFAWIGVSNLAIRRAVQDRCQSEGIVGLDGIALGREGEYVFLDLTVGGRLAAEQAFRKSCERCGRRSGVLGTPLRVASDSLPAADIFRLSDGTTMMLVTRRLADLIAREKWTGLALEPSIVVRAS